MKLLASDFDGTIYFDSFKEEDLKAINIFQNNGNKFGICTGRPLEGIVSPTKGLIKYDFYILNTGSYILDKDYNVIYKKTINIDTIKKVLKDTDFKDGVHLAGVNDIHLLTPMPNWPKNVKYPKSLEEVEDEILAFSLHTDTNENKARELTNYINKYFDDLVAFQNRSDIDIVSKGCSKGEALNIIGNYFNIDNKDMYCIGDSYNDIPMLEVLDNSYTFTNSPIEVKNVAKNIVDSLASCVATIK